MELLDGILTRHSVRKFAEKEVGEEEIRKILQAGMSGPACVNARDWAFVVVKDRAKLNAMADANGRPAEPLRQAAFAILICGDLERAFKLAPEYWVIDGAIAAENMTLAAWGLGIGSVWLGTYPQMERVEKQRALFDLPKEIVPHSILAFGYPAEVKAAEVRDLYEESKVHFEQW